MNELADLERAGWEALSTEGAARGFYERVLDEQVLMLLPGGLVLDDRAQIVAAMAGAPWRSYALEDVRVLPAGGDAGLVAYGVVARREEEYSALVSSLYVRRPAGWRLAFHQQTPR